MKYEYVGTSPTTLASGQPVQFGDVVDLNKTQERANVRLVDAFLLVPAEESDAKSESKSNTGEEGDE